MVSEKQLHIVISQGLVEKDGKFLIIKRAEHEIAFPGKWEFPGGKVERYDSIIKTLKKEIMEETGLEVHDDMKFINDFEFIRPDGYHVVGMTFLCKHKEGSVKLSKDHNDFKWISPGEEDNYDCVASVPLCIQKASNDIAESLDVVDDNDVIIGKATIKEVHEKHLLHRIVHVLIFDNNGRMALQLRSKAVNFCPEHWSTIVGGFVMSGEIYEQAALRECKEETGIEPKIEFFSKDIYHNKNIIKHLMIYKTIFTGSFHKDSNDIEKIQFFTMSEIQNMINKGEKFHPELLFILKKHFKMEDKHI